MTGLAATEGLTPFRHDRGHGAILFDPTRVRQVEPAWFTPDHWGDRADPVTSGGRGGAWFVDAPFGAAVLRHYLRGGWAAGISRDAYLWYGSDRVRSFAEFRLTRELHLRGLPVPRPIAACYHRQGASYRASILLERLTAVQSLGERAMAAAQDAPWEESGRLIARFHRAGLDHADLNAHNILFDATGHGWLIDFDRGKLRIPATPWRQANLTRLRRSLLKLRGTRPVAEVEQDYARLRGAYNTIWERGY